MALHRRDHPAGFVAANFGVVVKTRCRPFDLIHVFNEWLAAFFRQQGSELALVLADIARHRMQQFALFNTRNEAPVILRFQGGYYGAVRVVRTGSRRLVNRVLSRGIFYGEGFAGKTLDKLAVDEHSAHQCSLSSRKDSSNRSRAVSIRSRVIINGGSMRITSGLFRV